MNPLYDKKTFFRKSNHLRCVHRLMRDEIKLSAADALAGQKHFNVGNEGWNIYAFYMFIIERAIGIAGIKIIADEIIVG